MTDEAVVTIVGIALIVFVLWFFFAPTEKPKSSSHEHQH
jgi:plastocyanin domain-containing protein